MAARAAIVTATLATVVNNDNVDLCTFTGSEWCMILYLNTLVWRDKTTVEIIFVIRTARLHEAVSHWLDMEEGILLSKHDTFSIS